MSDQYKIWTIREILQVTEDFLAKKGNTSARLDAEVLLAKVLNKDRIHLYVHFDQPLSLDELDQYRDYVKQRATGKPVAYILGYKEFMGMDFKVNHHTLIPRPDTEILVEAIIQHLPDNFSGEILDLGTGTGAIIISLLKHFSQAQGTAVDISPEALAVAKENGETLEVADRLTLLQGDMLEPLGSRKFKVIVSNPPYIPLTDMPSLDIDVKDFEPHLALTDNGDGLKFYKLIFQNAAKYLDPNGLVAVEVGIHQAEPVAELARKNGYEQVEIIPDYAGIQRVVLGWQK